MAWQRNLIRFVFSMSIIAPIYAFAVVSWLQQQEVAVIAVAFVVMCGVYEVLDRLFARLPNLQR